MNLRKICLKLLLIGSMALADVYIDDLEEDEYQIVRHSEAFAKSFFEDVTAQANDGICFISSTINLFHFDFLMNAYRSMTIERRNYFIDQLVFEASNLTDPAKTAIDKLVTDRLVLVSDQALRYAVDNYLDVLNVTNISYKKYDIRNKEFYVRNGNQFLDEFVKSPQRMVADNCTIGIVGIVGVQAKWKYPFKTEGRFMKAEGKFNFAHDLKFQIDILQIPLKGGEMQITIVISRNKLYYVDAQRLFQRAFFGKFNLQIDTVYLPKIAYSVIMKDYSNDRDPATKPENKFRCLTQKLVMNINEEGIGTTINNKPTDKDWDKIDWKYDSSYYPPDNSCTVDSPFFFTINYRPTNETVLMGKWSPSYGPYVEETIYLSDDYV